MASYQQQHNRKARPRRKRFADGSALVTYPDGSQAIVESAVAKTASLSQSGVVNYNTPAPAGKAGRRKAGKSGKVAGH